MPNSHFFESFGALGLGLAGMRDGYSAFWGCSSVLSAVLAFVLFFFGFAISAARCFKLGETVKEGS